jgi:lipopolysaccharide export system protein LptA
MKRRRLPAWLAAALVIAASGPAAAETAADLFSGFQAKSKDPVQVDAEVLEVYEEGTQRISVFSGNVVVRRGNTTLKAATITLYSDLAAKSVDAFTRIEAGGGIVVKSDDQTVSGKTAVVNMDTHTITVSGSVVLSQGGNVLTGSRLVINLTTGRARLEGDQVRGVFTPSSPPQVGQ